MSLPGWSSPMELEPKGKRASVIKRRRNLQLREDKKGDYAKRISAKIGEAPNLMSVVTCKSSIKQRAVKEAVERDKKNEQKKKLMGRKKFVPKHPIKQRDNQWTSALTGQHVKSVSKRVVAKATRRSSDSSESSSNRDKPTSSHSTDADSVKKKKKKTPTDDSDGKASVVKKKKKKPKAKVIPTFVSQHSDELESLADKAKKRDKSSKNGDEYSNDKSMDKSSTHSGKTASTGSYSKENKQILLEFEMPGSDGPGLQLSVDLETVGDMSSIESWPTIASEDSFDTKMNKMMQRWMDVNIEFDDDEEDKDKDEDEEKAADGVLDDNTLDHIVLASPSMEDALDTFENMTGVRPVVMGPLEGLGIQTAQVGMDKGRYIEIIAPDNDNPGPLSEELKALPKGRVIPYQYAIRATEISRLIEGYVYDVLGWDPDHICMVQSLPDGTSRQWDLLTMYGHKIGGAAPLYVKYPDPSEHPTTKLEPMITLTSFTIQADRDHLVHKLITDVGGIDVQYAQTPSLDFKFHTPKGARGMSCDYPQGLVFPGYNADSKKSKGKKKKSSKKS